MQMNKTTQGKHLHVSWMFSLPLCLHLLQKIHDLSAFPFLIEILPITLDYHKATLIGNASK